MLLVQVQSLCIKSCADQVTIESDLYSSIGRQIKNVKHYRASREDREFNKPVHTLIFDTQGGGEQNDLILK